MGARAWRERDHPRHLAGTRVGGQFREKADVSAWAMLAAESGRFAIRHPQVSPVAPPMLQLDVLQSQTPAERERDRREFGHNIGDYVTLPGGQQGPITKLYRSDEGRPQVEVWLGDREIRFEAPSRDPRTWQPEHKQHLQFGDVVGWTTKVQVSMGFFEAFPTQKLQPPPTDEPGLVERVGYRGGFTHSFIGRRDPTKGFALSPYPGRSEVIDTKDLTRQTLQRFRERNDDLLSRPDHYIGSWRERDEETGVDRVWLDVSIVVRDRHQAEIIGKEHNQIAMWDLGTSQEVSLGGTGE